MNGKRIYSFGVLTVIIFLTWFITHSEEQKDDFSELVKISLRDVGNQLLLLNQDSSSLILPIDALSKSKYELSFDHVLSFEPGTLVSTIKSSFEKAGLPEEYIVEVIQCADREVAYSYKMTSSEQTTIIPCSGRYLPEGCYTIELRFTSIDSAFSKQSFIYILGFVVLVLLGFLLGRNRIAIAGKKDDKEHVGDKNGAMTIGEFQFYPEQNKLVSTSVEISLSRKECELLVIFTAQPNQVVKRDELTKRVWEDNGVIVGRSLDTYISKLRKKLQEDDTVKLINVHGVGYKLSLDAEEETSH